MTRHLSAASTGQTRALYETGRICLPACCLEEGVGVLDAVAGMYMGCISAVWQLRCQQPCLGSTLWLASSCLAWCVTK